MRKIIVSVELTLNGVMAPVDWSYPYASPERGRYVTEGLFAADALIMGRETYEIFASAWPNRSEAEAGPGEEGFIARINSLPKYVVSTTLNDLTWNNSHLIKDNPAGEIARLKQQPGLNMLVYGAGPVAHLLLQAGLVDMLQIFLYPMVVGAKDSTLRLFADAGDVPLLKPVNTRVFDSGVVLLEYEPRYNGV